MDIKKILMKARPDLSETSAEHYEKTIMNLNKEMRDSKKIKSFAWLKNHEKILEHLSGKKSYLSQRNYLNAIIVALDSGGASNELLKKFSDKRDEHNNRYVEERRNNVSFGNQEVIQNMLEWVPPACGLRMVRSASGFCSSCASCFPASTIVASSISCLLTAASSNFFLCAAACSSFSFFSCWSLR